MSGLLILTPDPDWGDDAAEIEHQLASLRGLGLEFAHRPWTERGSLDGFDLITPLMAWGYHQLPEQWLALLDDLAGRPVINPVSVLRWNWDKSYLLDLATKGVSVVPTLSFDCLSHADVAMARHHFGSDDIVIKPPISGGADGTFLLCNGAPAPDEALHLPNLIQPMMPAIATEGEYSLIYFDGCFSHAVLKTPQSGDFRVQAQYGGTDRVVDPEPAMLALAEAALAATPAPPQYARVDMVRDGSSGFALMELELIEPFLWLLAAPDGGRSFAATLK